MPKSRNKIQLSPQLKLGVGRGRSKNRVLKYGGFIFLLASFVLVGWTTYVVYRHSSQPSESQANPSVLGAEDDSSQVFTTYTVAKGDTVFNIAQKYEMNWTTLATINNLSAPFTLKVGQTLKIPNQ
jgi:nucleoid-associated protein YgaU